MNKRFIRILSIVILSIIICCEPISAFALDFVSQNEAEPEDIVLDELNIVSDCAVLEGQTQQMSVEETNSTFLVKWSSSNPSVISCDASGKIKGLKEGKAVITAEAIFGDVKDSITVYCAQKLNNPKSSRIGQFFAWTSKTPFFIPVQAIHFNMFPVFDSGKLNVKGVYSSYFYVEFERNNKQYEGFILQNWMPDNIASGEVFRQLSTYDIDVYSGVDSDLYKLTTNYKGDVKWTYSDDDIIDFDSTTGKIKTKKPGIATISATANGKTLTCTVHSIYRWPQNWTGAALEETYVYKAKGNSYEETSTLLAVGDEFIVKGDMGNSDGWAYGVSESGAWGFVKINDISSKGTVSQYNSMTTVVDNREIPWVYPIKETKFNKISSPYGWRNGNRHLGLDINKGDYSTILDEEIVAPFTGKVVFVNKDYNYTTRLPNYGYCIIMETSSVDPVSGNKLRVVFMHLNEAPSLNAGTTVTAGKVIGKVGTTGNSTGPHLHLEINNKGTNFAGMNNSDSFDKTINPIFFYLTSGLKDNSDSTYNEYWYNDNK